MSAVLVAQTIVLGVVVLCLTAALAYALHVIRDVRRDVADFALKVENRRMARDASAQMRLPFPATAQMVADLDRGVVPKRRRAPTAAESMSAADLAHAGSQATNGMLGTGEPPRRRFTTDPPRE